MIEDFPQKAFYTIGEVSRITGVRPHVLRYWEGQGKLLKPSRRRSRHRLYRLGDIQRILEIKRLRDEEKLPLAAMRRQLLPAGAGPAFPPSHQAELLVLLHELREELQALKALLD